MIRSAIFFLWLAITIIPYAVLVVAIAVTSDQCWPRRTFRLFPGTIVVSIGKPISSPGRRPVELMREVENWIEAEMRRLTPADYE